MALKVQTSFRVCMDPDEMDYSSKMWLRWFVMSQLTFGFNFLGFTAKQNNAHDAQGQGGVAVVHVGVWKLTIQNAGRFNQES